MIFQPSEEFLLPQKVILSGIDQQLIYQSGVGGSGNYTFISVGKSAGLISVLSTCAAYPLSSNSSKDWMPTGNLYRLSLP